MNIKVLQWLIAHREVLTKVLEAVKGYRKDLPYLEQWDIVDKVARIVIPVLTKEDIRAMSEFSFEEDEAVTAFAIGAEYSALGLDWSFVISVLVPILRVILASLENFVDD